ncbi:MAG TPA: hypothetical protein VNG13_14900 [Mycobacteriales bacterium]|nr:hypothetical protein [Mycobacteriales bacterium]
MDEERAEAVVARLRERRVFAHVERAGVYQFGVRVVIPDGREAVWDTDGNAGLEAVILQDGDLVGYVPELPGSEGLDVDGMVRALAAVDYDTPPEPEPPSHPSTPAPAVAPADPNPAVDPIPAAGPISAADPIPAVGPLPPVTRFLRADHPEHRPLSGLLRRLSGRHAD